MDRLVRNLVQFLTNYQWLLDTYMIEFFTERHWEKLPPTWRDALGDTDLVEASWLLLSSSHHQGNTHRQCTKVYPLSLLAFAATAHALSLPADPRNSPQDSRLANPSQVSGINHLFRRHVKPKKQHEIKLLGEEVFELSQSTKCKNIIDVGSGQGHLARYLAFHYGLNVTTVEAVGCHLATAAKFDSEVMKDLERRGRYMAEGSPREECCVEPESTVKCAGRLSHLQSVIQPGITATEFLTQLQSGGAMSPAHSPQSPSSPVQHTAGAAGGHVNERFIFVGLHTCGDLGPTMLRVFRHCDQIVGLVSVGCCYMKVTCPPSVSEVSLYQKACSCNTASPLHVPNKSQMSGSGMLKSGTVGLSDEGRSSETASGKEHTLTAQVDTEENLSQAISQEIGYPLSECVRSLPSHSLSYEAREVACHALEAFRERLQKESEHLQIHCYRAAVETVLRKHGLRRSQVRISKRASKLPFEDYAKVVLQSAGLPTELDMPSLGPLVAQWERVAVFFVLRVTIAPCVESLMLLDRAAYLQEQGYDVTLRPIFDPKLSPRNIGIIASSQSKVKI